MSIRLCREVDCRNLASGEGLMRLTLLSRPSHPVSPALLTEELPEHGVVLRRQPLLGGFVVILLIAGALAVLAGTILGLADFRDSGYPDSATLLQVKAFLRSGQIYPAIDRPPYLVTLYGPMTFV